MNQPRDLRSRAQAASVAKSAAVPDVSTMTLGELQKLAHELQVHQIELEMQNEELLRTQCELEESRSRYLDLYNFAPVAYVTLDAKGIVRGANLTAARLFGVHRKLLIGKPFSRFVHELDQDFWYRQRRLILETRGKRSCELRLVKANGDQFQTQLEGIAAQDQDGRFSEFGIVLTDITDRKHAEASLLASEKKYRALFENVADPIFILELEGERAGAIISANTAAAEIHGYTLDEIVTLNIADLDTPESAERIPARLLRIQDGKPFREVTTHRKKDGTVFTVEINPRMIEIENHKYVLTMDRDVTEREASRTALQGSQRTLKTILATSPVCIVLFKDRQCIWINEVGLNMFGYDNENELIGQRSRIIYDSEAEYVRVGRELYTNLETGRIAEVETKLLRKDGSVFDARIRVKLVDPSSLGNLAIGVITDLTDEIRGAQEKAELQTQFLHAQKMEAIGTLAGGIAHDFNNLLQIVLGYSQIMLDSRKEGDSDYSEIKQIYQAGERGAELVKSLMTFSRKPESQPKPINLNEQVEQLSNMLARTFPPMIAIERMLDPDLATINADPTQMDQVLMNLAVNARDAMHDEGKLSIKTANVILDDMYCSAHIGVKPGPYVLIMVSDTGHGMDKECLGHIFEPFFTTKEEGKGTGLGLASVYGIVRQHNGSIDCYSAPGQGTTFKIHLPAIPKKKKVSEKITRETSPKDGTETLLFVEDEKALRVMISRILTKSGYTVMTACDGEEALGLYKREGTTISLIILDLMMPKMSGQKCLEEILRIDPKAKILIATGVSVDSEQASLAKKTGAKGSIHKPYDTTKLLRALRDILDKDL